MIWDSEDIKDTPALLNIVMRTNACSAKSKVCMAP